MVAAAGRAIENGAVRSDRAELFAADALRRTLATRSKAGVDPL